MNSIKQLFENSPTYTPISKEAISKRYQYSQTAVDISLLVNGALITEMWPYCIVAGGSIGAIHGRHIPQQYGVPRYNGIDLDIFVWKLPPKHIRQKQYKFFKEQNILSKKYFAKSYKKDKTTTTTTTTTLSPVSPKKHAWSFNHDMSEMVSRLQLIPNFVETPHEITSGFDFIHLDMFYECWSGKIVVSDQADECFYNGLLKSRNYSKEELDRIIRSDTSTLHPDELAIYKRIQKYHNRGFKIS